LKEQAGDVADHASLWKAAFEKEKVSASKCLCASCSRHHHHLHSPPTIATIAFTTTSLDQAGTTGQENIYWGVGLDPETLLLFLLACQPSFEKIGSLGAQKYTIAKRSLNESTVGKCVSALPIRLIITPLTTKNRAVRIVHRSRSVDNVFAVLTFKFVASWPCATTLSTHLTIAPLSYINLTARPLTFALSVGNSRAPFSLMYLPRRKRESTRTVHHLVQNTNMTSIRATQTTIDIDIHLQNEV
jgi:hypothetical protein